MKDERKPASLKTNNWIAGLVRVKLREYFFRQMAFIRNLAENDEILMIISVSGPLSLRSELEAVLEVLLP